ncbi:serine/threonine protein phosphatase 2A 57 kDa regulatory subunit B' alpha isoform-like [Apium graveolens]|uniref:serine/threonine protein phosphatase 2A 57 kDa regulatory subunit B' alpha isoform-like n=1 Tax=Apium graveolens TaxID=4045 RepID=UPI003D7A23C9
MGAQRKSPSVSRTKNSITLQYLFDLDSRSNVGSKLLANDNSASRSSTDSEDEEIMSVISYCTITYSFDDPSEVASHFDLKRLKLIQLLSIIKTLKKPLEDQILQPLFQMLSSNLFRPLPPPCNTSITSILPDDDDLVATSTAAWPHLQLIYDILLRLIISMEAKDLQDFIDQSFITNLLYLFQSEDPRERESLKNVYHRIYSKFTFYRALMRKGMNDVFLYYVFETDDRCHWGIGDLLEIWGSIINGFTVPLKEEHKLFLKRVLIPLHKPTSMQAYHRQLSYCVSQFVQKEPVLGGIAIRGILKFWPVTNCQKEVLLIGELEELVEYIDPGQYRKFALPICSKITKCSNSRNSQVAERALYVWNNEEMLKMASQAMDDVFPVLVQGIENNLKTHWSKGVHQLTENVKVMLEEIEPSLYKKCLQKLKLQNTAAQLEEKRRKKEWDRIESAASRNEVLQQQLHTSD